MYTGDFLRNLLQKPIPLAPLDLGGEVSGAVARLDLLHPVVSGNKLFKLWYYLDRYHREGYESVVTFGGAYSNHLVATAFACSEMGIPCMGVVRGEEPRRWGQTLEDCRALGMQLAFVSREEYRALARTEAGAAARGALVIPEGGAGALGIRGAGLILKAIAEQHTFSHILMAVGTGTTLQGIDRALLPGQRAVGVPVIAVPPEEQAAFAERLGGVGLVHGYSLGGYGKHTPGLLDFMRSFYEQQGVPTDFVYTGKAAFALMDLAHNGYFPRGSRVLFLHTGGLQGNRSLSPGVLGF
ncbi:1-aminocyclopropane-1-carboxylate deaminase/D-cysteine desulfhydrase [Dinghuibacter silviterrae]|uniref:1-aminocyclopropane-1-carboxylate deaminase n=1 Tax=Dinghuibacter silviterrae TaxID=1539049 RepID=A0A4R8DFW9_9BACT|nr:pyridoxal-phosphate dependent enzyme [Dinghuibacter silviterrae]TDW96509.1 1-aminocyclopropane-1-carboxylate deaminase [Dinghuibacter silviterrae]